MIGVADGKTINIIAGGGIVIAIIIAIIVAIVVAVTDAITVAIRGASVPIIFNPGPVQQ